MKNNWQVKRLDEVATVTMGQSPPSSSYNDQGIGTPFFQGKPSNIDNFGVANAYQYTTEPTRVVTSGTALMTVRAPVGDIFTTPTDVCIGRGLSGIKANTDVSQKYLNYQLQFASQQFYTLSQGSTFTAINSSDLKGIQIGMPSFSVQKIIADILTSVDETIQKTNQIIQKSGELKNGLMKSLLTKGIGNKKYVQTKLGEIPNDWKVTSILDADIQIIDGDRGVNYPKQHEFFNEGFCLFLSNKNIKNDTFEFSETSFIAEDKDQILRKGKLNRWDVILTTRGTVGNVAIYDNTIPFDHIRINSGMLIFRAGQSVEPEYLYFLLRSPQLKERYKQLGSGSAQPQLPIGSLRNLLIAIPPLNEQRKIVELLKSAESKYKLEVKSAESLLNLKKGLMNDIFNQKVEIN